MECCIYIDSERDLLNFLFQIFLMKKLKTLYQSYLVVDLGGGGGNPCACFEFRPTFFYQVKQLTLLEL